MFDFLFRLLFFDRFNQYFFHYFRIFIVLLFLNNEFLNWFLNIFSHFIRNIFNITISMDLFTHVIDNLVINVFYFFFHLIFNLHIINVILCYLVIIVLLKIFITFNSSNFFIHRFFLMAMLSNNNILLFTSSFWRRSIISLFLTGWFNLLFLFLYNFLNHWRFSFILISKGSSSVPFKTNFCNNTIFGMINCSHPYWLFKLIKSDVSNLLWLLNILSQNMDKIWKHL